MCACVKVTVLRCAVQPARCPADGGGLKELSDWRPAGHVSASHSALAEHIHTHTHTQLVILSVRLCEFSTHAIQGLAAHVRLSPSDHSSEPRKSAVAPESRRTDWSRIGTRPPNQRDVLCYIVEAKPAYYGPGLASVSQTSATLKDLPMSVF